MKKNPLLAYFACLSLLSAAVILTINALGEKGVYFAQVYMLTPALAAIITRLFFYEKKFSDANLRLGKARHWLQFWLISALLAGISYLFFTLFYAVSWDFSGQSFLDKLEIQFNQSGQKMEDTLPPGFTPQLMLTLYFIGSLTVFNILPGLITGMGEEFGHRGMMFRFMAEKNLKVALVLGGLIWFAWHLPLGWIMPTTQEAELWEMVLNSLLLGIGSICTHTYFAYVLMKTRSIWIAALAHITFNNASTALSFFVSINDQTRANAGLVLTMVLAVLVGFWKFNFWNTLKGQQKEEIRLE